MTLLIFLLSATKYKHLAMPTLWGPAPPTRRLLPEPSHAPQESQPVLLQCARVPCRLLQSQIHLGAPHSSCSFSGCPFFCLLCHVNDYKVPCLQMLPSSLVRLICLNDNLLHYLVAQENTHISSIVHRILKNSLSLTSKAF